MLSRRHFLVSSAAAGLVVAPLRLAFADVEMEQRLVVLMLRGAALKRA